MPTSLLPERIVVGLDGSVFSERSLPVASDLAGAIGADLMLLSVVEYPGDREDRAIYLDGLRRGYDASTLALLLEPDARRALARRQPGELLCLATRGRTAVIRSVLGSVAFSEVAAGHPSLLVGFSCARPALDRPVAIAVGGDVVPDQALATAASWATKLSVNVDVITATAGARDTNSLDAEHAVDALAGLGVHGTATVLTVGDDPIHTVCRWLRQRPPWLLVAPTALNSGEARALLHSYVADLVGQVDVPVLAVPNRQLARPDRAISAPAGHVAAAAPVDRELPVRLGARRPRQRRARRCHRDPAVHGNGRGRRRPARDRSVHGCAAAHRLRLRGRLPPPGNRVGRVNGRDVGGDGRAAGRR